MLLILKSSTTSTHNHIITIKEIAGLKHGYNIEVAKYVLVDVSWRHVLDSDHNNQTFHSLKEFLLKK